MNERLSSEKRINLCYCLLQIGFWGMLGAFGGFQSAIVLDRGFAPGQAGLFIALSYLSGMIFQPLLGAWADRHPQVPLKWLFAGLLLPALALNFAFYFTRPGVWGTAAFFLLLGALETNAYPLMDAMAMQYINAGYNVPYSLGRGLGAFSYAIVCVILGLQTAALGMQSALVTHGALIVVMIGLCAAFPAFAGTRSPAAEKETATAAHSALEILRSNPSFALMLLGGFFGMMACMPVNSFLVTMVEDLGGGSDDYGLAVFLMAAAELPAAFVFQKLRKKLGTDRVLLIALLFMTAKPLAVLLSGNLFMLLAVQPIQMLGYGLFTPANVYFANENVAAEDRVQGQSLKTVLTNSMGSMTGNFLAGYVMDWGGAGAMLRVSIAAGCVGLLFGAAAIRTRKPGSQETALCEKRQP